jgi:hypothetical protein
MRPSGVRLSDLLAAGGKVPAELVALAQKQSGMHPTTPAPSIPADRDRHQQAMRAMQRENAALRLELLKLRHARAIGQASRQTARAREADRRHKARVLDRVALWVVGAAIAVFLLYGWKLF